MLMVLWRRFEERTKVFSSGVVPRHDDVGILSAYFGRVLSTLKGYLGHYKVLRIRKALRFRPDQDKVADLSGIAKRKTESDVATVRTRRESNLCDLAIVKDGRDVIRLEVGLLRCQRTPITSPIVPDDVKLFTESRPNIVPNNAVVKQKQSPGAATTFLVIQSGSVNLDG